MRLESLQSHYDPLYCVLNYLTVKYWTLQKCWNFFNILRIEAIIFRHSCLVHFWSIFLERSSWDSSSPETVLPLRQFFPGQFFPWDSSSPETVLPLRQFFPGTILPQKVHRWKNEFSGYELSGEELSRGRTVWGRTVSGKNCLGKNCFRGRTVSGEELSREEFFGEELSREELVGEELYRNP